MKPRRGGESGKIGPYYEHIWTVNALIEVLKGNAQKIELEPLDEDRALGIEFVLHYPGREEFHSAKRQTEGESWSLATLTRGAPARSILGDLFKKCASKQGVKFVSCMTAGQLWKLCSTAKLAGEFDTFKERCEEDKVELSTWFASVLKVEPSEETAFRKLQKLEVIGHTEEDLVRQVESFLSMLVRRKDHQAFDPEKVRLLLAEFAIKNLVKKHITRDMIWNHLDKKGYCQADFSSETTVDAIARKADEFVRFSKRLLIQGQPIPRDEVSAISKWLAEGHKVVCVSGVAGQGKSCILGQFVEELRTVPTPVMVVRADTLPGAVSAHDLGKSMDLPVSPSAVLAGIAREKECVLVIDQLDTVSILSGRNTELWPGIEDLLLETEAYPKMKVVIACRAFDLDNDHRLRRINTIQSSTRINVADLSESCVDAVLKNAGQTVNKRQKGILRNPLHLFLFVEGGSDFISEVDLFDSFWEAKRQRLLQTRSADWDTAVYRFADLLSSHESLSTPKERTSRVEADILASENILVEVSGRYRFFHETFFDYAFARSFFAQGRQLAGYLEEHGQGLFRRSQVRQVLAYKRQRDFDDYISDLTTILSGDFRFHLKEMLTQWLGQVEAPTRREWDAVKSFLKVPELKEFVFGPIAASPDWFPVLDEAGEWERWLKCGERDRVIWAFRLNQVLSVHHERITELLEPYLGDQKWRSALAAFLRFGDVHYGRSLFEFFLNAIKAGIPSEDARKNDEWFFLQRASETNPEWGAEAFAAFLEQTLTVVDNNDLPADPFGGGSGKEICLNLAEKAPSAFARNVFPVFVKIADRFRDHDNEPPAPDRIWFSRGFNCTVLFRDALLTSVALSLEKVAKRDANGLDRILAAHKNLNLETVEYLVLRAWMANPERYAKQILEWYLSNPRRLQFRYFTRRFEDGYVAVARKAITVCSSIWSKSDKKKLQNCILKLQIPWEEKLAEFRGQTKLALLGAFDASDLSAESQTRLSELRAKFPDTHFGMPKPNEQRAWWVGPPVPGKDLRSMNDEDLLACMTEHKTRVHDVEHPERGGPDQLADTIGKIAEEQPDRFLLILGKMPEDLPAIYTIRIIIGIVDAAKESDLVTTESLIHALEMLVSIEDKSRYATFCDCISQVASRDLPDLTLETLCRCAALDVPKPKAEDKAPELFTTSINHLRGKAAHAMARVLSHDSSKLGLFEPGIRALIKDESMAVRAGAIEILYVLLFSDFDIALQWFEELLADADDAVLGSDMMDYFLGVTTRRDYRAVRGVLQRMLRCDDSKIQELASVKICLAALDNSEAEEDAESTRSGSKAMRTGAAKVYAANLDNLQKCSQYLPQYFHDQCEAVRVEAANCFKELSGKQLLANEALLNEYARSPAAGLHLRSTFRALESSTARLPDTLATLLENVIQKIGADGGDVQKRAANDAGSVAKMVLRLYHQASVGTMRSRCLDMIDAMAKHSFYGLKGALDASER